MDTPQILREKIAIYNLLLQVLPYKKPTQKQFEKVAIMIYNLTQQNRNLVKGFSRHRENFVSELLAFHNEIVKKHLKNTSVKTIRIR